MDQLKKLVREGKIPQTEEGRAFVATVCIDLGRTVGGDGPLRASMRAVADLGLFFKEGALPSSQPEDPFIKTIEELVPAAAASYRQAVEDLKTERVSYRGPANELRQALWEVLQTLAPDEAVAKDPDYRQEPGTKGPTHRQRAAFIMRQRRGQDLPEATLAAIEAIAAVARQTYTRSNDSTHSQRDRDEALQVQRYVEAVLRDILA